jgi:hypothetical protein
MQQSEGDMQGQYDQHMEQRVSQGGSQSRWRVDTTEIRDYLERKLKGITKAQITYQLYTIIDKNGQEQHSYWAKNDDKALEKLKKYCDMQNASLQDYDVKATEETRTVVETTNGERLLPDDVCDDVLTSIEPLFSQVGYLTKYNDDDINDRMWRNLSKIRSNLVKQYLRRDDMELHKLDLVLNLIDNMIHPILKASQGGFTAKQLSDSVRERMVTHENTNESTLNRVFG